MDRKAGSSSCIELKNAAGSKGSRMLMLKSVLLTVKSQIPSSNQHHIDLVMCYCAMKVIFQLKVNLNSTLTGCPAVLQIKA